MGKLYDFVQKVKPETKFKVFWAPDFCVYSDPAEGTLPVLVASVNPEGSIVWENGCQAVLGMSSEEAAGLLAVHRRE